MRFNEELISKYYGKKHLKKISIKQISENCGISQTSVSNFFANNNRVGKKTGDKIMKYLDDAPQYATFIIPVRSSK
jgi:plasmid maintenance system antidote protein VapI